MPWTWELEDIASLTHNAQECAHQFNGRTLRLFTVSQLCFGIGNMSTSLNAAWRSWIKDNLRRRCSIRSLVEAMVAKDFAPADAAAHIAAVSCELSRDSCESGAMSRSRENDVCSFPSANLLKTRNGSVMVRLWIEQPPIMLLGGVLADEECNELITRSRLNVTPSTIVDPTTGRMQSIQSRNSAGTYFPVGADEFIARIDERLSDIAERPLDHAEGLQTLTYGVGGEYRPHFDFFPPEDPGSQRHIANGGQRVGTIIIYLNDVEEGGHTVFPRLGISFAPRRGDAVYFQYGDTEGIGRLTLHGGAPVLRGEKWIATKWFRQHQRS